jgi:hypothetical protein
MTDDPSVPVSRFSSHSFGTSASRPRSIFASMSESRTDHCLRRAQTRNIASSPVTSPQACPDAINAECKEKCKTKKENKHEGVSGVCAVNYAIGRAPTTRDPRSDRFERSPSNQSPISSRTIALNLAALNTLPQTTAALRPKATPQEYQSAGRAVR